MTGRFAFTPAWGADHGSNGTAAFRLWAPALDEVRLRLEGAGDIAMESRSDGWFTATIENLRPGLSYSFVLPDGLAVPDPAARAQAGDVHGPSALVDPRSYPWQTPDWRGRPWHEAVLYELHVGTFTPEGTFTGIIDRLDHLAETGITAVELMPVSQFSGRRGWGYDGVLPYCPHNAYGGVDGLKELVDAAHGRGLMVLLDVVYNHFGPDGNYLGAYAPDFFDHDRPTPWGPAIRFESEAVRAFFRENALYWLEEYRLDGLRFDAIDQIYDTSDEPILVEIARAVRERFPDRHIHLTTEDERNIVSLHPHEEGRPVLHTAEWNDDFHHAAHCIATNESAGYYAAFIDDPVDRLLRVLCSGFAYQGEHYPPWDGAPRGEASAAQPPGSFVAFLQNHDQIGNRAFGERLTTLTDPQSDALLTAILLLSPQIPLLFMGEEWGETNPFLFFTDFHGELAAAVREGRRREFAAFAEFADAAPEDIPDPNDPETFERSRPDWRKMKSAEGENRLALVRHLIALRQQYIAPRLATWRAMNGTGRQLADRAFAASWRPGDGSTLAMWGNFSEAAVKVEGWSGAKLVYESREGAADDLAAGRLPDRSVIVGLEEVER